MYYSDYDRDDDDEIRCPFCGSIHVTPIQETVVKKKGFRVGRSLVGGLLLGPIGLTAGFIGSDAVKSVDTAVKLKCLKCGQVSEV